MFLLRLGELLEEWTRKKSLGDLARCMSLNVDRVWQQTAEGEVLVPISQIRAGDAIVVHTGSVIPLDGKVLDGEASVNQASLTGEAEPVRQVERCRRLRRHRRRGRPDHRDRGAAGRQRPL